MYGSFPHFSEVVKVRQEIADAVLSHAFRAAMHGATRLQPRGRRYPPPACENRFLEPSEPRSTRADWRNAPVHRSV